MSAIVPFSVALTELQRETANIRDHRHFLKEWQAYGLWVSAEPPTDVCGGIRNEAVQKLWAEAFKTGLHCQRDAAQAVDDAMTAEQLRALRGEIQVVCLGQAGLRRLAGAADEGGEAPEVSSFDGFDDCASVRAARELRRSGIIEPGRHLTDIWREWFAATAKIAPTVAIVDRYALLRGAQNRAYRRGLKSGLERFLEFLRDTAGKAPVEVSLYTCTPSLRSHAIPRQWSSVAGHKRSRCFGCGRQPPQRVHLAGL